MDQRSRYKNITPFLSIDNRNTRRGDDGRDPGRESTLAYAVLPNMGTPNYSSGFINHFWEQGDRIDYVAHKYLGSSNHWYKIMHLNPHVQDPLSIEPGTLLRVPVRGR